MKKNLFDFKDKHEKKLKLAKFSKQDMKVFSTSNNNSSHSFHSSHSSSKKGGFVVQGQTVIVKTNYEVAGKMKRDGSRASRKDVGTHASASLDYMNNHGAEDIKDNDLSNIYNEEGDRLSKEEFKDLKREMESGEEFQAMRRVMIDPGQEDNLTRDEINQIVRESMNDFMRKTDKEFDFKFAIHTDKIENGGNMHAHVIITGDARDININREQLQTLKQTISEKTHEVLQEKELDCSYEKELDKHLTLDQQIDKELDGKLDNKFNEEEIRQALKDLEKEQQQNQGLTL